MSPHSFSGKCEHDVDERGVARLASPMFVAAVRLIPAGLIIILWAMSKRIESFRRMPKAG